MVAPTIFPTGFAGDYTDFLKVKSDRSGAVRRSSGAVTIPSGTTTSTIAGLFPFTSGMSFASLSGYNFYVADLDTASSVTINVGVAYQNTTEGTDNLTLITSASTAPQAGGYIAPSAGASWQDYVTTGNGWVIVQTGGATTGTSGAVTYNTAIAYDQPPLIA